MAVWCFGSVNVDHVYEVDHIPRPGETLAAAAYRIGLGGKGANQAVAAARAGADVHHIGAVGPGAEWIFERLQAAGVGTGHLSVTEAPTGHAIISVGADGENAIVILAGANAAQDSDRIARALAAATPGDSLLIQNETTLQEEAARLGRAAGLRVLYSAAPFDAAQTARMLPLVDTLLLNEIEARELEADTGRPLEALEVAQIVVTLGAEGARWIDTRAGDRIEVPGLAVEAVDTTGAGDTFAGYLAAGLDAGLAPRAAMELAGRAAALKVTRRGTADAIPTRADVDAFLAG